MNVDNETETKIIERLDRIADGMNRIAAGVDKFIDGMDKLDRIASGVDKLVEAIPKPASRVDRAIEAAITVVTIAGILSVIDIIINWIGG
jgi:hypothetical protein